MLQITMEKLQFIGQQQWGIQKLSKSWPSFYADTVVVVGYQKSGVPVLTPTNIKFHLNMEYTIFFFKIPGVFIRFFLSQERK